MSTYPRGREELSLVIYQEIDAPRTYSVRRCYHRLQKAAENSAVTSLFLVKLICVNSVDRGPFAIVLTSYLIVVIILN